MICWLFCVDDEGSSAVAGPPFTRAGVAAGTTAPGRDIVEHQEIIPVPLGFASPPSAHRRKIEIPRSFTTTSRVAIISNRWKSSSSASGTG